ncbi:phage major capsid protein [Noviherbaspirillum malthae]|uniref:phage major capsid protein n=1 Tax=Noviherbaspirillum malthae TaxID=1260987 RepID=UPI00188FC64A|nr:phage major capsid protein [Noviherbaspirillum malthae]
MNIDPTKLHIKSARGGSQNERDDDDNHDDGDTTVMVKTLVKKVKSVIVDNQKTLEEQNKKIEDHDAMIMELAQKAARGGNLIGAGAGEQAEDVGSLVTKSDQLSNLRDGSLRSIRIPVKSFPLGQKAAITNADFPGVAQRDTEMYGPLARRLTVRDLLITKPTTATSIEYVKATRTGAAAVQEGEGTQKAELGMDFELETAKVATIACWVPASRQLMDDNAALQDFVNNTLLDELQLAEDTQLLLGSGDGSNINGLMTQATAYNRTVAGDTANDTLRRAITQIQLARGVASGIVINPVGLERLELEKDSEGRFLVTLNVTDADGRTVTWRVPVVVTDAIGEDDFLVGDFVRAARLYDRQQATVEVATQHADFFTKNMIAILAEERLAMTVPRPTLLVKGTFPAEA